jgi:hypothetical protein
MEDGSENGGGNEVPFFHRATLKGDYALSVKNPGCFKTELSNATMKWSEPGPSTVFAYTAGIGKVSRSMPMALEHMESLPRRFRRTGMPLNGLSRQVGPADIVSSVPLHGMDANHAKDAECALWSLDTAQPLFPLRLMLSLAKVAICL